MNTNHTSESGERISIYDRITNQIVAAIETGVGNYKMPWHSNGADSTIPINAFSRKPYRGVNIICLWVDAMRKGYPTNLWATFKQWRELGAHVRKGEQASTVVFWKFWNETEIDAIDDDQADTGETPNSHAKCMARAYSVFNAAQVDGYSIPEIPRIPEVARIAAAEVFFRSTGADIREGGNRAYYSPSTDHIQMPPFSYFRKPDYFYSTLGHETCHWTSAPARCDRQLQGRFGTEAYAMEELIAELGSAFLSSELGLSVEPRADHAPYVQNWLHVLRNDKRAIFTAAAKAQTAVDWLLHKVKSPERAA